MASDSIFSGLKVVDFASFIAGPSAAVILSDFGADVVKVEPPTGDTWRIGHKIPPQPQANEAYPFHLANRNKRGVTLDLKSPSAQPVLERLVNWADVFIVNTPHPARKRLMLEYDDVAQWNPRLIYADLTGFGEKGPDADLPGFDITAYWARSGLLSMTRDAGEPPTWPVAGSGDNATAVGLYSRLLRRSIVASEPARDPMSRRRSSLRASGRQAFRSRLRYAKRNSSDRTTERIRQMRR
jgi:crotonobetainyl-CoA:carnitine CoA-transferase CaiB-like acyl-CoA transferase